MNIVNDKSILMAAEDGVMETNTLTLERRTDAAEENPELRFLFCRHFRCPDSDFERQAFRECLYTHARFLAPLLSVVFPHFFDRDRAFIKTLGTTTRLSHVIGSASHFHDKVGLDAGFRFNVLRIRVSGANAIRLAEKLFRQQKAARDSSPKRHTPVLFEE